MTPTDPAAPLWHDTGPSLKSDAAFPPAADIAIAGAGLTGVAAALLLARAGHRVVVFDATRSGARTTGGSTAKLSVLQGTVFQKLREAHDDATVAAYAEAQLVAQRWLRTELADAADAAAPANVTRSRAHGRG